MKFILPAFVLVLLGLGLITVLRDQGQLQSSDSVSSQNHSEKPLSKLKSATPEINLALQKTPSAAQKKKSNPRLRRLQESRLSAADTDSAGRDLISEIDPLLASLNLTNKSSMIEAVAQLKSTGNPGSLLDRKLRNLRPEDELKRDKIVFLAGKIESKDSLPLWRNLLFRETPRFANESEIRQPSHPTVESRLVAVEQGQAIRKLGQLAFSDSGARKILFETILAETPVAVPIVLRELALRVLTETDPNAYLKTLARLDKKDPLFQRISRRR